MVDLGVSRAENFPSPTTQFGNVLLSEPSVLWHCWFGVRKSIWPVKNWAMRCRCCLKQAADWCTLSSWCRCKPKHHHLSPHTQVVLEKRPLNGCSSTSSSVDGCGPNPPQCICSLRKTKIQLSPFRRFTIHSTLVSHINCSISQTATKFCLKYSVHCWLKIQPPKQNMPQTVELLMICQRKPLEI